MTVANPLAYSNMATFGALKRFMVQAPIEVCSTDRTKRCEVPLFYNFVQWINSHGARPKVETISCSIVDWEVSASLKRSSFCSRFQANDTQHNDTQHNAIQHNDTQHNDTRHNDNQPNGTHIMILRITILGIMTPSITTISKRHSA
jgi:hypothetical protein